MRKDCQDERRGKRRWRIALLTLALAVILTLTGCGEIRQEAAGRQIAGPTATSVLQTTVEEDGYYSSKAEVGLYLYLYGKLPGNYLTKQEARELGWISSEGNLWEVAPGGSIGGDRFRNYEGQLPKEKTYFECDIDYGGGHRGAKRIVYSDDGYIYYSEDHYTTFVQLYP